MFVDGPIAYVVNRLGGLWDSGRCVVTRVPTGAPFELQCSIITAVALDPDTGDMKIGASVDIPGEATDVSRHAGVLRVVSGPELWTFSAPDASTLTPLASVQVRGAGVWEGDRVYASDGSNLTVVDVADPKNPTVASTLPLGANAAIAARERKLVVLTGAELLIYDASNPARLEPIARANLVRAGEQVWLRPRLALVEDGRLAIVSAVNDKPGPSVNPRRTASYRSFLQLVDVDLAGGSLTLRGRIDHPFEANTLEVADGFLATASDSSLQGWSIRDRDAPGAMSRAILSRDTDAIAVSGDVAVVATSFAAAGDGVVQAGLRVVPARDPDSLLPLAEIAAEIDLGLFAHGTTAFALIDRTLSTFDLPTLAKRGAVALDGSEWPMVQIGSTLFAHSPSRGAYALIDASDAKEPTIAARIPIAGASGGTHAMASPPWLHVVDDDGGLTSIECQNPRMPIVHGRIVLNGRRARVGRSHLRARRREGPERIRRRRNTERSLRDDRRSTTSGGLPGAMITQTSAARPFTPRFSVRY